MPLQQTSGNVTQDAYGGGVAVAPVYIEDVMSTFLYTGNGSTQTITNGIDLSTKGGLVWIKGRSSYSNNFHTLTDTVRGAGKSLTSNDTSAQWVNSAIVSGFTSTGFSVGAGDAVNLSGAPIASWTFRKQPKFFDVVTYTGDGSASKSIAHNLGSVPGCIIVKATSTTGAWAVWHRSGTQNNQYAAFLDQTGAYGDTGANIWGTGGPSVTSSSFTVGTNGTVNASGQTYVAYLFAHNAGGFGLTGTDNVISCGSYAGTGSLQTINLGYEAQWVLIKRTDSANSWYLFDNMRGLSMTQCLALLPNGTNSELDYGTQVGPSAIGFTVNNNAAFNASGGTYIYIAIRRGPMKVPTDATKVFVPVLGNNVSTVGNPAFTTNFVVDSILRDQRSSGANAWMNRLTGATYLRTSTTNAEASDTNILFDAMNGVNSNVVYNWTGTVGWNFQRAPGFFDEVCYTGNAVNGQTYAHNLGVAPELMIIKRRDTAGFQWIVYAAPLGASKYLALNLTDAAAGNFMFNATAPTASVFTVSANQNVNGNGTTLVNYLFATCPGVSKVGSYTGNGTTQTINCGFAGGARFVLIKRTDSAGDWYVYDTARGMTTLTDPYLLLNSTAAESATLGSVTSVTTGFAVNASILAAINTNAASYIYLAIA